MGDQPGGPLKKDIDRAKKAAGRAQGPTADKHRFGKGMCLIYIFREYYFLHDHLQYNTDRHGYRANSAI